MPIHPLDSFATLGSLPVVTPEMTYAAACAYVNAGLSVIPIVPDGTKRPAWGYLPRVAKFPGGTPKHSWRIFQRRYPTEEELRFWFLSWGPARGVSVLGGIISGGLEVLDFDTADLIEPWAALVRQQDAVLLDKLVVVVTPRPGAHFYYRCPAAENNQKLAEALVINSETCVPTIKTLIETRGAGGYSVAPPSPLACHPSLRPYRFMTARDLTTVQTINEHERNILVSAARSFHSVPPRPSRSPFQRRSGVPVPPHSSRPGDDFNSRADWGELLTRHGWTFVSADMDGTENWRRPGKQDGTSATVNYAGSGLLYVFSSNAAPLQPNKPYSKFSFLTILEFSGDYKAAASSLQARGYGRVRLRAGRPYRRWPVHRRA